MKTIRVTAITKEAERIFGQYTVDFKGEKIFMDTKIFAFDVAIKDNIQESVITSLSIINPDQYESLTLEIK